MAVLLILTLILNGFLPTLTLANEEVTPNIETENLAIETAEITTGDSLSGVTLESQVNTNEITTEPENNNNSTENNQVSSSTTTPEENFDTTEISTTSIDILNIASSTNNTTSTSNTGHNEVEAGSFVTETGDSVSYVDLVNVVNTNIVNSTGLIDFIRDVLGYENFDMRDTFTNIFNSLNTAESTLPCGETICDANSLLVDLVNEANIYNDISVTADTGSNTGSGTGNINTGDAYASANIINMANTNIIDSNYLLLVFDNFSDMTSSLVLPNSDFFQTLFKNNQNQSNFLNLSNTANITNTSVTVADTGNNEITGQGTSTIKTGDAATISHTGNLINQNLVNSNSFSMLIRVHGNWSGDIFGLPEGMNWEDTGSGIRLFYNPENGDGNNTQSSITNITNDANITNNVKVFALTGDNEINNSVGTSQIETGDAYANNTIFNIANTNVVGSNWINLIFNIYGDWSGDLAFGQPDLWLGLSANSNNRMVKRPGTNLSYTYTIFNHGDVTAKNVILESEFPLSSLELSSEYADSDINDGKATWSIGDIKAGETKEFTVPARITDTYGADKQMPLPLSVKVSSDQADANSEDNSDSLMLYVGKGEKKHQPSKTFSAKFIIEKSANKSQAYPNEAVDYTIKLTNKGGPIFNSLLVDTLRDAGGNILSEQEWPLETIKNGETINITYTINLPKNIKSGTYTNTAQLVGLHESNSKKYQTPYESEIATHQLIVGDIPEGEVLGLSISTCSPYLNTYLRQHKDNDESEVVKLQNFLKQHVTTDMVVTGTFDDNTRLAVAEFQQQFADDILKPWNMTVSSGYVYYTTQKKINEIMCDDTTEFPLTLEQKQEIEYFKINKTENNVNGLLFSSSNYTNSNANDIANIEADPAEIVFDNNFYNPLPTYFQLNPQPEKDLSFTRFSNWLYIFRDSNTAYLDR